MEGVNFIELINNVGFPICCCIVLFMQNNKLTKTIADLKDTLTENTTLLKQLLERKDD